MNDTSRDIPKEGLTAGRDNLVNLAMDALNDQSGLDPSQFPIFAKLAVALKNESLANEVILHIQHHTKKMLDGDVILTGDVLAGMAEALDLAETVLPKPRAMSKATTVGNRNPLEGRR